MTPEDRAEALVDIVARDDGYQSMRLRGQSALMWHSGDAELMELRRREMVTAIARAIEEAVAEATGESPVQRQPGAAGRTGV